MRRKLVEVVVFVFLERMRAHVVVRMTNYGADAIEVRDDGRGIRASDYANVCTSRGIVFIVVW